MATKTQVRKTFSIRLPAVSPVYAYLIDVIVEPDDGQFYAHCPGVGGVHESGSTPKEALVNAYYALLSLLEIPGGVVLEGPHVRALREPPDLLALPKIRKTSRRTSTQRHILLVPVPQGIAHGLA